MQIENLPRVAGHPDDIPPAALVREKKLRAIEDLLSEGNKVVVACRSQDVSRATYYRWRRRYRRYGLGGLVPQSRCPRRVRRPCYTAQEAHLVLELRKQHPTYGRLPLRRILVRDYRFTASAGTVGRILAKGLKKGCIQTCAFHARGELKPKRKRVLNGHAQRWQQGMPAQEPGQKLQMDHLTAVLHDGTAVKDFKAICPISKHLVQRVYRRATANTAKDFLYRVIEQMPFPVTGIQVDGGSEFMAGFERACEELQIALYVLPPRRPQYNGCVERVNRTVREEFYSQYQGGTDLASVNRGLAEHQRQYNHYRPHRTLDLRTPMEYLEQHNNGA